MRLGSSSALAWVFRFHPTEIERKVSTGICALLKPGPAAGTSPMAETGSRMPGRRSRRSCELPEAGSTPGPPDNSALCRRLWERPASVGLHLVFLILCRPDRGVQQSVRLCTLRNVQFFWEFLANSSNSAHLRRVPRAIDVRANEC